MSIRLTGSASAARRPSTCSAAWRKDARTTAATSCSLLGATAYSVPLERYMRETKVTQIFEGTNQIQRMIIGRDLARS